MRIGAAIFLLREFTAFLIFCSSRSRIDSSSWSFVRKALTVSMSFGMSNE